MLPMIRKILVPFQVPAKVPLPPFLRLFFWPPATVPLLDSLSRVFAWPFTFAASLLVDTLKLFSGRSVTVEASMSHKVGDTTEHTSMEGTEEVVGASPSPGGTGDGDETEDEKADNPLKDMSPSTVVAADGYPDKDLLAAGAVKRFGKAFNTLNRELMTIKDMSGQEVDATLQKCTKRELEALEKALNELEDPWRPANLTKLWGCRNLPFPLVAKPDEPVVSLADGDLAELLSYADEIMDERQFRLLLGFIEAKQRNPNISAMARLFHVGEKRIRQGMAEYDKAGGLVYIQDKRNPGGGRPSVKDMFRIHMTPECIASGIAMENLEAIRMVNEANKDLKLFRLNDTQMERYLPIIQELAANTRELADRCTRYASDKDSTEAVEIRECALFLHSVFGAIGDISSKLPIHARYERSRFEAGATIFPILSNGIQTMLDTWDDGLPPDTILSRLEESFWTVDKRTKVEKMVISCHLFEAAQAQSKMALNNKSGTPPIDRNSGGTLFSTLDEPSVLAGHKELLPQDALSILKERIDVVMKTMNGLMQLLLDGMVSQTRGEKSTISEAIGFLEGIRHNYVQKTAEGLTYEDNEDVVISLRFWTEKLQMHLESFSQGPQMTVFALADTVGTRLLSPSFGCMNKEAEEELLRAIQAAESPQKEKEQEGGGMAPPECADDVKAPTIDEQHHKEECIEKTEMLKAYAQDLISKVKKGLDGSSWGNPAPIEKGLEILNNLYDRYCQTVADGLDKGDVRTCRALCYLTDEIMQILRKCDIKWDKTSGSMFAKAGAATSLLLSANKFPKLVENIWTKYSYDVADADVSKYKRLTYCDFASLDLEDKADWFVPHKVPLSPAGRSSIIKELYKAGKDPTDIFSWLDYIVFSEHCRTITDPSSMKIYSYVRMRQLKNAFFYLTGFECSHTVLWDYLTNEMNVKLRQPKETLTVEDHPLKNIQYRIARARRLSADPETTLCLYIDTKASVQLGWTRHDNGFLLAHFADGTCAMSDHSFPTIMRTIYPNGTDLVDSSRLDELAVLKPVGAYCPHDKVGYISFVLGQDTAESMRNLLWCVIEAKKKVMPKLERMILFADCGGANIANGIAWTNALADLSIDSGLIIESVHFAPGSSKLSEIEHKLWSIVSITWLGRPFTDIETVVRYGNEAGTSTGLTTVCWFDPIKYLTNEEKKQSGETVMTRAEIDLKLKGKIVHHYSSDTDLFKMNHTIFPERQDEADLALEVSLRAIPGLEEEAKRIIAERERVIAAKTASESST